LNISPSLHPNLPERIDLNSQNKFLEDEISKLKKQLSIHLNENKHLKKQLEDFKNQQTKQKESLLIENQNFKQLIELTKKSTK
jgi:hypothetical protein